VDALERAVGDGSRALDVGERERKGHVLHPHIGAVGRASEQPLKIVGAHRRG
jgi:hypothetical protein